jgi:hypothetical protein
MSESYLLLWTQDRLSALKKHDQLGKPLRVLYGSPHSSAPSLRRYHIEGGDRIFIVGFKKGALTLVCRIRIREIIELRQYLRDHLRLPPGDCEMHVWALEKKLAAERPELGHQLPFGCVDEAAIPDDSTPLRLDVAIPPETLATLQFCDSRGRVRGLPVENGLLKKSISIQGHYFRLTPDSVAALDRVIANASST